MRHAPSRVLLNAEVEKKNKYAEACPARRAHFTPLCFSVDGLAGSEANCFLKWIACKLSSRWDRSLLRCWGGFVPDWLLQLCELQCCVCVVPAPNGEVWALKVLLPLI